MGEFEEKLNGILNNPAEMEKILMLARSFMGNGEANSAPPPQQGMHYPPQGTHPVGQHMPPHYPASPPAYAHPHHAPPSASTGAKAPYPQPAAYHPPPQAAQTGAAGGGLDSLLGGVDLNMMKKLAKGFSGTTGSAALLQAMQPHLKDERQGQLKRAVAIAQMLKAAKAVFD